MLLNLTVLDVLDCQNVVRDNFSLTFRTHSCLNIFYASDSKLSASGQKNATRILFYRLDLSEEVTTPAKYFINRTNNDISFLLSGRFHEDMD